MSVRQRICASEALEDQGLGARFEAQLGQAGFVIRVEGVARGYYNRCPHRGTELDWEPGAFFDGEGEYLVCATHGALFEPRTGLCIAGPCRGAQLKSIPIVEENGEIYWSSDEQ